jgi:hypothetical protein
MKSETILLVLQQKRSPIIFTNLKTHKNMKKSIKNLEVKSIKAVTIKGGEDRVPKVIILLTDGAANVPTHP